MKEGSVIRDQSLPHFLTANVIDWRTEEFVVLTRFLQIRLSTLSIV
jgi:hypothetical protein